MKVLVWYIFSILLICLGCKPHEPDDTNPVSLQLVSISVGPEELDLSSENLGLPLDQPVVFRFSQIIDRSTVEDNIYITDSVDEIIDVSYSYLDSDRTISLKPLTSLNEKYRYSVNIGKNLRGVKSEVFEGLKVFFQTLNPPLIIKDVFIDGIDVLNTYRITEMEFQPEITVEISPQVTLEEIINYSSLKLGSLVYNMDIVSVGDTLFTFSVADELPDLRKFNFSLSSDLSVAVEREFDGLNFNFYTKLDSVYKFPEISDDELLTLVQSQTFKYFWDFAHPYSGLIRERNTSNESVTSGGSGFGIMAIIVGIERGFITREEGLQRLEKIVDFLGTADRFHGVWSHWLNGSTGKVIPFSTYDDGGDIVETSYLIMGLLTFRQYLDPLSTEEALLIDKINLLAESVEWDWYRQDGQNVLYWHWSPNYEWQMNHKLTGYNEALITYIIAAASTTHGIPAEVYHQGWARSGDIVNGDYFYDILLPLGNSNYGGPLFFEQYTYLGIDPRNLSDQYADYSQQTVNHTLINRQYCINNPLNYVGYSEHCWGLTASDGNNGYSAHSPTNDRGVITPTAAISSIPFTPDESMQALKYFYYLMGDKLWGEYGFYDAFNITENWYASSYIAIDQGPIILMIENYRTGLLWDLFMSCPEIQSSLTKLGFSY